MLDLYISTVSIPITLDLLNTEQNCLIYQHRTSAQMLDLYISTVSIPITLDLLSTELVHAQTLDLLDLHRYTIW